MKKDNLLLAAGVLVAAAAGVCAYYKCRRTIPEDVTPLWPFDVHRYLGNWYEIARLPMMYEKGLTDITAHYSMNDDGSVRVVNSGYDPRKRKWKSSEGKAVFTCSPDAGMLKVSFFGPFYAGYNVIEIDEDYNNALVFGRNRNYMWLLSRDKVMPKDIETAYLKKAEEAGYDLSRLIWTDQENSDVYSIHGL